MLNIFYFYRPKNIFSFGISVVFSCSKVSISFVDIESPVILSSNKLSLEFILTKSTCWGITIYFSIGFVLFVSLSALFQ